jgi:hypothetical protein
LIRPLDPIATPAEMMDGGSAAKTVKANPERTMANLDKVLFKPMLEPEVVESVNNQVDEFGSGVQVH